MAPRTSFLSRQPDVIASFSFGAYTVQTCFQHIPRSLKKVWIMSNFQPYLQIFMSTPLGGGYIKRPLRDACLCMGELPAPPAPPAPAAPPAPHFVFLITL